MSLPIARIVGFPTRLVLTDEHSQSSYGRFVLAVERSFVGQERKLGPAYGPADPVPEAGGVPAGDLVRTWAAGGEPPEGLSWYGRPESERRAALARLDLPRDP